MFEYRTALFHAKGMGFGNPITEVDQFINSWIAAGWDYESLSIGGNNAVVVVMRRLKPPPVPEEAKSKFFQGIEDPAK